MLALVSVEGYHGYLLFVWIYGIFLGGFETSLRVYCYERLRIKHYSRGWGYVQGARFLPLLLGFPISAYISRDYQDPKAGFYFSFSCCVLGGTLLFLMECFKGGNMSAYSNSMYGGSRMDLCKTDTNMTFEMVNGNGGIVLGESASDSGQGGRPQQMNLKCTCSDAGSSSTSNALPPILPPSNGGLGSGPPVELQLGRDLVLPPEDVSEVEAVVGEASVVKFNDNDIEVVPEEAEDQDPNAGGSIEDLAQALHAAGVRPEELLECISEERSFDDNNIAVADNELVWSEYQMEDGEEEEELGKPLSRSVPDLVHLDYDQPEVRDNTGTGSKQARLPHPSSRPLLEDVKRQRTWHHFKRVVGVVGAKRKPSSSTEKNGNTTTTSEAPKPERLSQEVNGLVASEEEITSFV